MKSKDGRDHLTLSECVVSLNADGIRISDAGASMNITLEDFSRLVKFVTKSSPKSVVAAEECGYETPGAKRDPLAYLANGMRFKLSLDDEGKVGCFWNMKELDGRWVALVAAENDVHLSGATQQPVNRQLLEALQAGPSTEHTFPSGIACKCSQCEFVRLRRAAIAAASAEMAQGHTKPKELNKLKN